MSELHDPKKPASVVFALMVGASFTALLLLEIGDGIFRRGGELAKSTFVLPGVVVLVGGLALGRAWARKAARGTALPAGLLNLGFALVAVVAQPQDEQGPVWIWLAAVSLALAAVLGAVFWALGRPAALRYFQDAHRIERHPKVRRPWLPLVAVGLVALLVGLGFVCPPLAVWRNQGDLDAVPMLLLWFGTLVAFGGLIGVIQGLKRGARSACSG